MLSKLMEQMCTWKQNCARDANKENEIWDKRRKELELSINGPTQDIDTSEEEEEIKTETKRMAFECDSSYESDHEDFDYDEEPTNKMVGKVTDELYKFKGDSDSDASSGISHIR